MKSPKVHFQNERFTLLHDDVLTTRLVKDSSIDLVVTSPPYNVDIQYNSHKDDISYAEYLEFSKKWMRRCYLWLKDEGRFCLNIPLDKNKGGQQSVGADLTMVAKEIGFQYHATIIWNEGNISRRTAWGSWKSASAPFVIAPVELIVVLYKNKWKKTGGSKVSDVTRAEFMEWTNGMWTFNGESKKKIGHPAPFPIELPRRCIKLFSYVDDVVLDPFCGSGTTLIAAVNNDRKGIGIDLDKKYSELARQRILDLTSVTQGEHPKTK
jgi:site-specific DNA-methyltransferase (adenine-specific)